MNCITKRHNGAVVGLKCVHARHTNKYA